MAAKKFSLKDNPIFQQIQEPPPSPSPPPPPSGEITAPSKPSTPATEDHLDEDSNLTLKNRGSDLAPQNMSLKSRPSEIEGQNIGPKEIEPQRPSSRMTDEAKITAKSVNPSQRLKDNLDKALFFGFYNEMSDEVLPTLPSAEQVLFSRLFRLSYGFNKNYCTVSQPTLIEKTGLSKNTVRVGLQALVKKEWIAVVESGNHISTTYLVVLPSEKKRGTKIDPQNLTPKNRESKSEGQILALKSRASNSGKTEGQNTALQNLTHQTENKENALEKEELQDRGSKSDPQKLTPLLFNSSNINSLTERENFASQIVEKFYEDLKQSPSATKRDKGIKECMGLLTDGFTAEQISYATSWLVRMHPETGSFSRLLHFIDQALKEREAEQKAEEKVQQKRAQVEKQEAEAKQEEEEGARIEQIKASLAPQEIEALSQEAEKVVQEMHGDTQFGRETLVKIEINKIIRTRYGT